MANNRQKPPIPLLSELAFKTFWQNRNDYATESDEYETSVCKSIVIDQALKLFSLSFLQAIADADPLEVEKFLDGCPELAVLARGTVKGASGYIYENHSAIDLACVMDDHELMTAVLLPAIQKLPIGLVEKAKTQLENKTAEIKKQRVQLNPCDLLIEMINAINRDQTLKDTGEPNETTQIALAQLKNNFKLSTIKEGKTWIKEYLQEAICTYNENCKRWNKNQSGWYLVHVIGHLQTRVEKCFEQECSQGLDEIVNKEKPNARGVTIKNCTNGVLIAYRGASSSSLDLGRNFYVEIINGIANSLGQASEPMQNTVDALEKLYGIKKSAMENIQKQLEQLYKKLKELDEKLREQVAQQCTK